MYPKIRVAVLLLVAALWQPALAAVPGSLSYQAYLTNADGSAVEGSATITFSIYIVDVGGSALWSDTQTVPVDQGLFSVALGNPVNPFPAGLFDTPLFIGINVEGDGEMLPRRKLTSVGFAFESDNALSLQGQGPAAFDQSGHVTDMANPHGVTVGQTGGATDGDIANLQSQLDAALASITSLQNDLSSANSTISTLQSDLATETINRTDADAAEAAARIADVASLGASITDIEANTVLALDGILTHPDTNTALFSGVNVQVVNGTDTTDGDPNGVGNVIVGYNTITGTGNEICSLGEFVNQIDCESGGGNWALNHKSGSHNVVVGDLHNYSRFGGLIVGLNNDITGDWSSVSAGGGNSASGRQSSISGGIGNTAGAANASVSGGQSNAAEGVSSSVSGGSANIASGNFSSVSGGGGNTASDSNASVSGGSSNAATGVSSSVSGGLGNTASGINSSISGGRANVAFGARSSVSSGFENTAEGDESSVGGGNANIASGDFSSVAGGADNTASGSNASVSGGRFNAASDDSSNVSGGINNTASGDFSSVSGGGLNVAAGVQSSVSGGQDNTASGINSSISGGSLNDTIGAQTSVSGGLNNTAFSTSSSVTGGDDIFCFTAGNTCGEGAINPAD